MKKIFLIITMLLSMLANAQESPKWRVMDLGLQTATNLDGTNAIIFTSSIYYELKNKYAITSWTGYSTQKGLINNSWLSTEVNIEKGFKSGITLSYGLRRIVGSGSPGLVLTPNNEVIGINYVTFKVAYRIKL